MSEHTEVTTDPGLEALFDAQSVAVIGASDDGNKISGRPFRFLLTKGFHGRVYAVNPKRDQVQGQRAYKSLAEIPEPIDLVIIVTPAKRVLGAVQEAAQHGVKVAVIFAGGFAEVDQQGREVQQALYRVAREAGMRLVGPNTVGVINFSTALYATFTKAIDQGVPVTKKGLAVVSQSGALANYVLTQAIDRQLPISKWVSTGNESDLEFAEVLRYLAQDPDCTGIIAYLEGARNGRRLKQACEIARLHRKPITLMKVGSTDAGAKAVTSHTDAVVGDDDLYDALFRQRGVHRVHSIHELFDIAQAMVYGLVPDNQQALITTVSGGVGIIMAEEAERRGLLLPRLTDSARSHLKERLPFMSPNNPLDVTGQAAVEFHLFEEALRVGMEDTGANIVVNFIGRLGRVPEMVSQYLALLDQLNSDYPQRLIITVGMFDAELEQQLREKGVLHYGDPSKAVAAAAALARFGRSFRRETAQAPLPESIEAVTAPLDEMESYQLLQRAGVPVPECRVASSIAEVGEAFAKLEKPVVMKILSPDIVHKTDVGGVRLKIDSEAEAQESFTTMMDAVASSLPEAELRGVLMMPMTANFTEVLLAVKVDPQLGPALMLGLGGVLVEVIGDVSVRPAPVSKAEVFDMIDELKGKALFGQFRGRPAGDVDVLAETAAQLSRFAVANQSWLKTLEINPFALCAAGRGGVALDCFLDINKKD